VYIAGDQRRRLCSDVVYSCARPARARAVLGRRPVGRPCTCTVCARACGRQVQSTVIAAHHAGGEVGSGRYMPRQNMLMVYRTNWKGIGVTCISMGCEFLGFFLQHRQFVFLKVQQHGFFLLSVFLQLQVAVFWTPTCYRKIINNKTQNTR
jgi:hypothetical protein